MSSLFDPANPDDDFVFDSITKETFNIESTVTEHPVEKSALNSDTVPDNVILKPVTVNVAGIVSNTPAIDRGGWTQTVKSTPIPSFAPFRTSRVVLLGLDGFNSGVEVVNGNIVTAEQQTVSFVGLEYPTPRDFIFEQIGKLVKWRKASTLLTYFALSGHIVDNLLIVSWEDDLEGRIPDMIASTTITLVLKRVKLVSTVATTAPKPKKASGLPKKSNGKTVAKELSVPAQSTAPQTATFDGPGGDGGGSGAPATDPNDDVSAQGGSGGTGPQNSEFVSDVDGKDEIVGGEVTSVFGGLL